MQVAILTSIQDYCMRIIRESVRIPCILPIPTTQLLLKDQCYSSKISPLTCPLDADNPIGPMFIRGDNFAAQCTERCGGTAKFQLSASAIPLECAKTN